MADTAGPQVEKRGAGLRRRIYDIIEVNHGVDTASRAFDAFIVTLIVLNVAAFVAETVPSVHDAWGAWLWRFEVFSVLVFTGEYVLRIWTAVEVPFLSQLAPWRARLKFAQRPFQIIDLLAILPFYLGHILGLDLRALRVLRLLKFSRYSPAMHTLIRVLQSERRALAGAMLLMLVVLLFASTGIYFLESHAQPDKFGSVPQSAWWAMATLTTVGYGDIVPITVAGRIFGGIVMLAGLCTLALPVAIISTGFAQEVNRHDFVVNWSLMSRIPLLAELDAAQVAEIMPLMHAHHLANGTEIIAAQSPAEALYFVASGQIEMREPGGHQRLSTGDFFGDVGLPETAIATASFRAVTRCRVLKIYRRDFERLAVINPAVADHVRKVARQRLPQSPAHEGARA